MKTSMNWNIWNLFLVSWIGIFSFKMGSFVFWPIKWNEWECNSTGLTSSVPVWTSVEGCLCAAKGRSFVACWDNLHLHEVLIRKKENILFRKLQWEYSEYTKVFFFKQCRQMQISILSREKAEWLFSAWPLAYTTSILSLLPIKSSWWSFFFQLHPAFQFASYWCLCFVWKGKILIF